LFWLDVPDCAVPLLPAVVPEDGAPVSAPVVPELVPLDPLVPVPLLDPLLDWANAGPATRQAVSAAAAIIFSSMTSSFLDCCGCFPNRGRMCLFRQARRGCNLPL
jgi:hypothetical protein